MSDDLISRDELLKAIDTWDKFGYSARYGLERLDKDDIGYVPYIHYDDVIKCIEGMPSVNPQESKTGCWIKTIGENGITSAIRCSECGFEDNRYMLFRYCPNCGAKMESEVV